MIVPDINVLLYATLSAYRRHRVAHEWWEGVLNGSARVGLCDPVIFGFVRMATNRRVFQAPLDIEAAAELVNTWLGRPMVSRLSAGPGHVGTVLGLLEGTGTAGNLTTDAQIAAIAMEHSGTVYSTDTDFKRFPAVRSVNPLA